VPLLVITTVVHVPMYQARGVKLVGMGETQRDCTRAPCNVLVLLHARIVMQSLVHVLALIEILNWG
jgi:hypothetical protein